MKIIKPISEYTLRVFVSYSHKDRKLVNKIVTDLKSYGIDIWIDQYELIGGESIRMKIENAIEKMDLFLIALSPNSVSSRWVQEEIDMIFERSTVEDAIIVPLILEECKIPAVLRGKKWIDFTSTYNQNLINLLTTMQVWSKRKKENCLESMIRNIEENKGESLKETSIGYSAIGRLAMTIGKYKYAINILQQSIEKWDSNWDAYNLLAGALLKIDRFEEAEDILNVMLTKGIQKGRAYYNLACMSSRKAKVLEKASHKTHDELLEQCYEYLVRSFSIGFVSWLRTYASRVDPVGDILSDPDLFYARNASPKVEDYLNSLSQKYAHNWTNKQVYGGNGGGCMDGNSEIYMADGTKQPIGQIKCGDLLLSVTAKGSKSFSKVWRKLRLWETSGVIINNKIVVSSTQLLYCVDGWRRADSLKTGDILLGFGGMETNIKTIIIWNKQREVYHMNLDGSPVFIAENVIVHNVKYI